jgi:hypothetical protein
LTALFERSLAWAAAPATTALITRRLQNLTF